jgi:UDP-glucuronate decarboxylase
MIEGLVSFMQTADATTGPINLGNPNEITVLQLAKQVINATGSRSRIIHRAMPQDDPRQRCPDISKAQDTLGWSPRTPLREGLTRTIAYFERLLQDKSVHARLAAAASTSS